MTTEVEQLEATIRGARTGYAEGTPTMEDAEYDALVIRLSQIAPESPVLQEDWVDNSKLLMKAQHIIPMGSQDKANEPEEFDAWFSKQPKGTILLAQYKLDGASIELQYKAGRLIRAVTRGDGKIGDDVTMNVKRMEGVQTVLKDGWSGAIRGEVVMRHSIFDKYFKDKKANCRNAAVGIMKRVDGEHAEKLTVICYDVWPTNAAEDFKAEREKIAWLSDHEFLFVGPMPPHLYETVAKVTELRNLLAWNRVTLDYDIDGIVLKNHLVDRDDERLPRPTRQIAYKFPLDRAVTTLRSVTWQQAGKTFTPVAIFDPVKLAGAEVTRANLVNLATIKKMGLRIGSTIEVVRRGEVIPKVEASIMNPATGDEILPPIECPSCNAVLSITDMHVECPNPDCKERIKHRILSWLDTLKIKGIGPATVDQMVDDGTWTNISSLYSWEPPERNFRPSVDNIYQAIRSKTEISLAQFIAGYDLDGIGVSTIESVVGAGYRSMERLLSTDVSELEKIPGIGSITAQTVVSGIGANLRDMTDVLSIGIVHVLAEVTEGTLLNMSVCFTGPLNTMSRDEAELKVKAAGGQAKSSVVKGLTYLVTNDPHSGSAKNKKAQAQGTKVINEEQFLALLKGEQVC